MFGRSFASSMKTRPIFPVLLSIVGILIGVCAPKLLHAQTELAALPAQEISRIKAQEFAHSLAQLKIQEVALQRAVAVDDKALALNRAQQGALDQELVKLAVGPLEQERQSLSNDLRPAHPRMVALNAEIEKAKASVTGGH